MRFQCFFSRWLLPLLAAAGTASAQALKPELPVLPAGAIPRSAHGAAAIAALADKLPEVARHHGLTPERLDELLRRDPDLKVDSRGQLFFEESHLPESAKPTDPPGFGDDQPGLVPPTETFLLHSRPSATRKIYLDFDGHTTSGTLWTDIRDNDNTFVTLPYNFEGNGDIFSENELVRIQYIWQRVAEDFSAFDVDVTTEDPGVEALRKSTPEDLQYGVRVCIGGSSTDWYSVNAVGGVAYVGSFSWDSDTPCYVWSQNLGSGNEKYVAEAVSHEVGHTVNLYHDGTSTQVYYPGHGTGADGWAPIMGVGYYEPVVQFSRGEYAGANNLEDDLAKMTTPQFIPYIADDFGNGFGDAASLSSGTIFEEGLIERADDVDMFRIKAGAGAFAIDINVDSQSPNLNVEATLYNGQGQIIALSNPPDSLGASLNLFGLPEGTYYLQVAGVGAGNPLNTGYSDYGSIGTYSISATLPVAGAPIAVATADPTSGLSPLIVQFSSEGSVDPDGGLVTHAWDLGNGVTSTDAAPQTTYLTSGVYVAILTVTDDEGLSSSISIPVTVTGSVPGAPTGLVASTSGSTQVDLAWVDNATNETGFRIERSTDGINFSEIATTEQNTTLYSDVTVVAGITYSYRVGTYNSFGSSSYSTVAWVTTPQASPAAPTNLSVKTRSSTQIDLKWTDRSSNETGFRIERSLNGSAWTLLSTVGANVTAYSSTGLSPSTTYYFRVQSFNSGGASASSNTASTKTRR